jgi:hypothetical protein
MIELPDKVGVSSPFDSNPSLLSNLNLPKMLGFDAIRDFRFFGRKPDAMQYIMGTSMHARKERVIRTQVDS